VTVPGGHSLAWRGSLNAVQALLDYGAKLVVALVLVPVLVTGLGRTMYGVWEVLSRLAGYMESADGRPTRSLRLVIANQQAKDDPEGKRRWVGAALTVSLLFLPVWVALGAVVVWFAPAVAGTPGTGADHTIRWAAATLAAAILLTGVASIAESVLRGSNLGYRRMGLQATLSVLGGGLLAGAVLAGLGIAGMALAQLALAVITGLCYWSLVRRYVPWFGIARPHRHEVKALLGMSGWISAGNVLSKLVSAGDVVVLGAVTSASTVATYVLTGYAPRVAMTLHALATDALMPGVGRVIGEQAYGRLARLRRELLALTWLFTTTFGTTVLLWNESFVRLWVGPGHFAGHTVSLLIVAMTLQSAFIRCDSYLIDAALQPRRRVQVSALSAVLTIALSSTLGLRFGAPGLCVGILAGRLVQSISYPILARACLGYHPEAAATWLARPALTTCLLFAPAAYLGRDLVATGWLSWGFGVITTIGVTVGIALLAGLPADLRAAIFARARDVGRRLNRRSSRS
jgi:O-antigen/teichoic acid export membrane protein